MASPSRAGIQGTYLTGPYQVSYSATAGQNSGWFGPLAPLAPIAPADVAGRQWDFPTGYNLNIGPKAYEPVGFVELRGLADGYDLLRLVIETRKDQVERLRWAVNPRDPKFKRKSASIAPDMLARINTVTTFLRKPDGFNNWKTWVRALIEDLLVIDAPTLYCKRNRGGKLLALEYLDGATIKRVIDDWGRTPQAFSQDGKTVWPTAYQQVLKGYPAIDYTTRDLIYRPRNVRSNRAYGYSPVEQVIMTVNIALRRQLWQLNYYTEGNIPESLIGVPENWTPDQVKSFQAHWDNYFTGNLASRRHAKFVPGGVAKTFIQTKEPELQNSFDEWLARIVCFAFSIPPTWAVKMMNRASGQQQSDQAEEEGIEPTKEWIKELIDGVIAEEFDSPDLELAWVESDETDPSKQETILEGRLKVAGITLNEFRDQLGLDPYADDSANKPMVYTPTGYVPIEANTIEGKQANIEAFGMPPAPGQTSDEEGEPKKDDKVSGTEPNAEKLNGHIPFTKARARRLAPVPFDRPTARQAVSSIAKLLRKAFAQIEPKVIAAVRQGLGKVAKDKKPKAKAQQIADDLDFSELIDLGGDIGDDLGDLTTDSGRAALAQLGVDDRSDLVNQVNDAAVQAAKDHAAELVSGVDERTRSMVRDLIAGGLENNIGADAIADGISDSGLFSDERADLIARTEVSRANSEAALDGYRAARDDAGVAVKKSWLLGPDPCQICEGNADDGDIDLDDDFSSGDDAPPAHPNCECAVVAVVEE